MAGRLFVQPANDPISFSLTLSRPIALFPLTAPPKVDFNAATRDGSGHRGRLDCLLTSRFVAVPITR